MAAPTLAAEGSVAVVTNGNLTVTLPAHQTDDILVVTVVGWVPNTTSGTNTIAAPSGWTKAASDTLVTSGVIDGEWALFWRRAASGSEANPTFTRPAGWDTGNDTCFAGRAYVVRGVRNTGNPWDAIAQSALHSAANGAVPAVTVSGNERTVIQFFVSSDDRAAGTVTGWTAGTAATTTTGTDAGFQTHRKENVSSSTAADTSSAAAPAQGRYIFFGASFAVNDPPTVTLNTADGAEFTVATPTLEFTGTDPNGNDVRYNIEIGIGSLWDVSTATYNNVNKSVGAQDTAPYVLVFKSDGTRMYVVGNITDRVYQYDLSIPWDISTATYNNVSKSVGAQDIAPFGLAFKSDGTRMYVVGDTNDTVYQYDLSTPWDISTATYNNVSKSVGAQDTLPRGLAFKSDGMRMYVVGISNATVYQYDLSTPWDISTATYNNVSKSVGAQDTLPFGLAFKSDGTRMYVVGNDTDTVYQYDLFSALLSKTSGTDAGFVNTVNAGDTDPFNSGDKVSFTVQAADELAAGTYAWRVRAIDPAGSNTYGAWTGLRTFTVNLAPTIAPTGIASGEAFGSPTLVYAQFVTGAGNIASGEAFGSSGVNFLFSGIGGVASGEAFGSQSIGFTLPAAGGIVSGEAFGSASANFTLYSAGSISSGEAFGSAALSSGQTVDVAGQGIASSEAFGSQQFNFTLSSAGAIASGEAFGSQQLNLSLASAGGIASGETFGSSLLFFSQTVDVAGNGIASSETFGSPQFDLALSAVGGIVSGEAFGSAAVHLVLTGSGGIASAEAFGDLASVNLVLTGVGSITSAEAFGTLSANLSVAGAGAIASSEAFGSSTANFAISEAGAIASAEAFGLALISRYLKAATFRVSATGELSITVSAGGNTVVISESGAIGARIDRSGGIKV